jgi:hypothetical protein
MLNYCAIELDRHHHSASKQLVFHLSNCVLMDVLCTMLLLCQVVVGSFLPRYQVEQNAKKPAVIEITSQPQPVTVGFTISSGGMDDSYNGRQARPVKGNSVSAFRVENWTAPDQARKTTPSPPPEPEDNNKVPVPGG